MCIFCVERLTVENYMTHSLRKYSIVTAIDSGELHDAFDRWHSHQHVRVQTSQPDTNKRRTQHFSLRQRAIQIKSYSTRCASAQKSIFARHSSLMQHYDFAGWAALKLSAAEALNKFGHWWKAVLTVVKQLRYTQSHSVRRAREEPQAEEAIKWSPEC